MKKAVLLIPLLLLACSKEPEASTEETLSVDPKEIMVASDDTKAVITIKSNTKWKVSCFDVSPTLDKDRWLTGYTKSGEKNGTVEISFTPNESSTVTRTATFRLSYGARKLDVPFTQSHADFNAVLEIANPNLNVAWDATSAEFSLTANVPWTVSTDADWIQSFTQSGTGDGVIQVRFDRNNNTTSSRTAVFAVVSDAGTQQLTIAQEKAPEREEALDVDVATFLAAAEGTDVLYRLTGLVSKMISNTYGSMQITDASGSAFVYCLLDGRNGREASFSRLGVNVGDCITVVGKRGGFIGGPELVDGYYESHKSVQKTTISEFLNRPDGNAVWFKLTGTISDVTDNQNGKFSLVDDAGRVIHVDGLLPGVGGSRGAYSSLGIRPGASLTMIATSKSGDTAVDAIYLSHSNAGFPVGIAARWSFASSANATLHFDTTWTGKEIDEAEHIDAMEYNNSPGDGGRYIDAVEGNGRLTYVQVDKTSFDANGTVAGRMMYYTAQPGVKGAAVGDYFLFTFTPEFEIPSGTKFKFQFCVRPEASAPGYFMVEYLENGSWKNVSGLPVSQKEGYSYNLARATSEQTITSCQFMTESDMEILQIRICIAAPYTAGGNAFNGSLASGGVRFRGVVSGSDLSPVLTVME